MSEPTQQQKCADLARAMGIPESEWPYKCFVEKHQMDNDGGNAWCYTCEMMADNSERVPPNPYESAADKDALVTWLTADDARWYRFLSQWERMLINRDENEEVIDLVREAMKGDRAIIADAAWLALQGKNNG